MNAEGTTGEKKEKKASRVIGRKIITPPIPFVQIHDHGDYIESIYEHYIKKEISFTRKPPPFELMVKTPKKQPDLSHYSRPEALEFYGHDHSICEGNMLRFEQPDEDSETY
jgi:hypothetical protein